LKLTNPETRMLLPLFSFFQQSWRVSTSCIERNPLLWCWPKAKKLLGILRSNSMNQLLPIWILRLQDLTESQKNMKGQRNLQRITKIKLMTSRTKSSISMMLLRRCAKTIKVSLAKSKNNRILLISWILKSMIAPLNTRIRCWKISSKRLGKRTNSSWREFQNTVWLLTSSTSRLIMILQLIVLQN